MELFAIGLICVVLLETSFLLIGLNKIHKEISKHGSYERCNNCGEESKKWRKVWK